MILEGNAGTSELLFTVTLNKSAVNAVRVSYSTASTAKAGGGGTGSANGGAACGAGVDYVAASGQTLEIAKGNSSGVIRVPVCTDTAFEPLETLNLVWSLGGASGTVTATIVNDDAGGLNGTGVATGFGRDSLALTNSDADGRLGFSFANVADASGVQCIRDNVTGLLWEGKTAANAGLTFPHAGVAAEVTNANNANLCGYNDWRLPKPEELASIVDLGTTITPVVDNVWFTRQQAGSYWTATPRVPVGTNDAWYVDFTRGQIGFDGTGSAKFIRLVSDGGTTRPAALPTTCADASRFVDHGDGTVTDGRTGLMWKKCVEGRAGGACAGTALTADWSTALARADAVNADAGGAGLGYGDWRLPTRAELSSITEREQCAAPVINATVFVNSPAVSFWSSTPVAFDATRAWSVDFNEGGTALSLKTTALFGVRLVRAGQ
jgi:hypothetical protein